MKSERAIFKSKGFNIFVLLANEVKIIPFKACSKLPSPKIVRGTAED